MPCWAEAGSCNTWVNSEAVHGQHSDIDNDHEDKHLHQNRINLGTLSDLTGHQFLASFEIFVMIRGATG